MRTDPWLLVSPGSLKVGVDILLDEEEARHASGVLRCRVGDRVVLADGAGVVAHAEFIECARSRAVVRITGVERTEETTGGVQLVLAVLHTKAMDWAVQKAVEVGAQSLFPGVCGRSQGDVHGAGRRLDHWRRVSRQALKQCHRPWMMKVFEPEDLETAIGRIASGVVADPEGGQLESLPLEVCRTLLVGPEGGFTPREIMRLDETDWLRLNLGPHVLRAETAAIVGAAILGMRFGRNSS